ncbi:MAG: hypothetical protein HY277_03630, partial [Ignavibacteriales bacterium]|nr:hypothetical protein [Ignavibacteriales bacterium]
MRLPIVIGCMLIIAGGFACKETPPAPYVQSVFLSVEDAGVTDAFLKVHLLIPDSLSEVVIKRNGQRVLSARLGNRTDTLVVDDSLSPNQTYTYKAYRSYEAPFDSSDAVTVRTMDTTSHNFTWEIDTLGDGNSSVLNDVAIINDTLAYAVGETFLRDSTGQIDPTLYNLARWDGTQWHITRLYYNYQGQQLIEPLSTVFAFSENDIWVAGTQPRHWNGTIWEQFGISSSTFNGRATKLWGSSSNSLYMVGTNGVIAFYNNGTWQKLESGTDVDLLDVWGSPDG